MVRHSIFDQVHPMGFVFADMAAAVGDQPGEEGPRKAIVAAAVAGAPANTVHNVQPISTRMTNHVVITPIDGAVAVWYRPGRKAP